MKPIKRYIKVELPESNITKGELESALKMAIFELGGYTLLSKVQYKLIGMQGKYAIIRFKLFEVDPSIVYLIVPLAKIGKSWLIPVACSGVLNKIKNNKYEEQEKETRVNK